MRHLLAAVDQECNAVLMVQVENETGLLDGSGDRSRRSPRVFNGPVPEPILQHRSTGDVHLSRKELVLKFTSGFHAWTYVLGTGCAAYEAFMAHANSSFVDKVAAEGKKESPIPHYTNAWL